MPQKKKSALLVDAAASEALHLITIRTQQQEEAQEEEDEEEGLLLIVANCCLIVGLEDEIGGYEIGLGGERDEGRAWGWCLFREAEMERPGDCSFGSGFSFHARSSSLPSRPSQWLSLSGGIVQTM
ncbi:uncharacterized protein LOC110769386 [Prunus avium]|uniref:Uncharacterized protein LOC110769386 n=1 Tax=Prunus avium TaxID=42229 RepID=A0A6P5TPI7_PRUAV|nr:uncharacterized protein LOC110769386 [Prunus avium]